MVSLPRQRIPIRNCKLKYPTGEEVKVKFKVFVWVELGKFSLRFPMMVADINDECLLGADFFKVTNTEKVFETVLGIMGQNEFQKFACSRIESFEDKVLQLLKNFLLGI